MSIFAEEWRECLSAHYKNVVEHDTPHNQESLKKALLRPNGERPPIFTESELRELYIEATMHDENFVPSEAMLQSFSEPQPEPVFQPHPLECQCPQCIQINLVPHDDEGQPLSEEAVLEAQEQQQTPTQLSLF